MDKTNLGDRIKKYESVTQYRLTSRSPVIIRVDGRAFHSLKLQKPFDYNMIQAMIQSAEFVAKDIQGFKVAYIQSDEATFALTDYDDLQTQGWFDYKLNKLVSNSASLMTACFNDLMGGLQSFDSRAFNVPKNDVVNVFLWRAKDWERNSLQMFARSIFSHKQLTNKNKESIHEMLHRLGRNWTTELSDVEKNGTFLIHTDEGIITRQDILPTYDSINSAIGYLF